MAKTSRIHQSQIWKEMQRKTLSGQPVVFSFSYVKIDTGEIKHYPKATFSSIHAKGATVNIRIGVERFPKTFRRCLIITFNELKVFA
ncbi:MAG: hypothetical protein LBJ72_11890 [Dysgonamonadaceae bacterium]|jgi:hypothetical protein|nr:hypothetical protein [Dysgonamonadaceae bacterium]